MAKPRRMYRTLQLATVRPKVENRAVTGKPKSVSNLSTGSLIAGMPLA